MKAHDKLKVTSPFPPDAPAQDVQLDVEMEKKEP
jgi:hypothetical protein